MTDTNYKPKRVGSGAASRLPVLYASHDGYQVWLHLNDHRSEPLIALEPKVLDALVRYAERTLNYKPTL